MLNESVSSVQEVAQGISEVAESTTVAGEKKEKVSLHQVNLSERMEVEALP